MYYNKLMPRSRSRSRSSRKKSVQRRKFGSRTIYSIKTIRDLGILREDVITINHPDRLNLDEYNLAKQIETQVEMKVKENTEEVNNIVKSLSEMFTRGNGKYQESDKEAYETLMAKKKEAYYLAFQLANLYANALLLQIQYLTSTDPKNKQIRKLQDKLNKFNLDNFDIFEEYEEQMNKIYKQITEEERLYDARGNRIYKKPTEKATYDAELRERLQNAVYDAELRESISGAYEPVRESAAKNIDERTKSYLRPLARWLEKQIEENPRYFVSIPITSFAIVVSILGLRVFWRRIKSALQKAKDDYNVVQQFRKGKLELIDKSAPFKVKDRDLSREEKDELIVENYRKGNLKETQKSSSRRRTQKSSSRRRTQKSSSRK